MGRRLDQLLKKLERPPARPVSRLDINPLTDPLARPARRRGAVASATDRRPGPVEITPPRVEFTPPRVEFTPDAIVEIRYKFHATQRRFAAMFGISVETLRNWEQGKRRPRGPARALLRVARANPEAVARVLWRYRRAWWMD
jgi:putative transcriptional regulator